MSKSITEKVKAVEKQNRLVIENLIDAVWVVDAATLKYEYVTPSIQRICGYTSEELINKTVFDRFPKDSFKKCLELLAEDLRGNGCGKRVPKSVEIELVHKNGDTYWAELRAKLVEDSQGASKLVGVIRDISGRKKAELALDRQNRKLAEALADKERLLEEIKVLHKMLPICSSCKRIRHDDGKWWPLEAYIREHTDSDFTHTICPDCRDVLYPDLKENPEAEKN